MQQLPLEQQSSYVDAKLITKLYETKLKKYYETIGPVICMYFSNCSN